MDGSTSNWLDAWWRAFIHQDQLNLSFLNKLIKNIKVILTSKKISISIISFAKDKRLWKNFRIKWDNMILKRLRKELRMKLTN
jgi:hypothetical protein